MAKWATLRTPGTVAMRAPYEIGSGSRMLARFITRRRVSLIFDSAPSNPAMTPLEMPNNRNATAIDKTVNTVRIGLRRRPAQSRGRYFI
jgi:hypothetical protein